MKLSCGLKKGYILVSNCMCVRTGTHGTQRTRGAEVERTGSMGSAEGGSSHHIILSKKERFLRRSALDTHEVVGMEWFKGKAVFEIEAVDFEYGQFEEVKGWKLVGEGYSADGHLVLLFKNRNKYARVWY